MIDLHLIGIGTGNPDHLTRAAICAAQASAIASCHWWTASR